MSKDKGTKKHETKGKEVKKSKATKSTDLLEPSEGTQEILSLAKKLASATSKQTTRGCIRVYVDDTPIMRITGITKETPNVEIKPKLRETVADGKVAPEAFTTHTGLKVRKVWKSVFNGSNYVYDGEPEKLVERLRIFFKHAHKLVA